MSGEAPGTPVPPGTRFNDRYEVVKEIGRGGMGIVYLGRDTVLDRRVAIKVLPEAFSTDDEIIARFGREAKAMAALDHPNVVPVYDTGRQGNFNYFVMKFLDGETVADRLDAYRDGKAEPYEPEDVRLILVQVCRGLSHAHKKGMIHRDIKPGNIMVSPEGHATLMDFGIVKAPMGEEALTRTGIVFGTPEYMAPEQAQGDGPPRPPADLYALGVVAYEMLTGNPPFDGSTPFSLVIKHIKEPPAPLIEKRGDLDEAFQDVIFTAMAKSPDERFPDADAMRVALEALVRTSLSEMPQPPPDRTTTGNLPPSLISGEMIRQSAGAAIPARGTGNHHVVRTPSVPPPGMSERTGRPSSRPPIAATAPAGGGRRPPGPAVVRGRDGPAADDGPAVLEDRAGYYRSLVTRDPDAEAKRRTRKILIAAAVVIALAIVGAGAAMMAGGEPPPAPEEAP